MTGIFISYRRDDSAGHAGRLHDRLLRHFGPERVFLDVQAIEPGADYELEIDKAIAASDAVLVVIGRHWTAAADEKGRRLDQPDDWVRLEIAAAIRRKVRIVPVLVSGATMPSAAQLPKGLKPLARLQAVTLSDTLWDSGVNELLRSLDPPPPPPVDGASRMRKLLPWGLSIVLALVVAIGVEAWRNQTSKTVVPSVLGQTPVQAQATLRAGRLELGKQERRRVAVDAADGVILEQNPGAGGRAKPGSAVAVVVAQRARPLVPQLVGLPLSAAQAAMRAAGLRLQAQGTVVDAEAAPDTVRSQSVPAGQEADAGSEVAVMVTVLPPAPAAFRFGPGALDFGVRRMNTSSVESVVISNPGGRLPAIREVLARPAAAGFSLDAGSCIGNTLVAGERCTVDVYFVPRTGGMHETTLTLIDEQGVAHAGTQIVGEARADGDGGAIVVPRLARLSYDQAYFALHRAGLAVGNVLLHESASEPNGTVLRQLTAPGVKVRPRTAIDFVVAVQALQLAEPRADVPVLRGSNAASGSSPVRPAPLILHFVHDAGASRLCYGVSGAARVGIAPAVGAVRPAVKACVDVTEGAARRYTLVATGDGGQTARRTIVVR